MTPADFPTTYELSPTVHVEEPEPSRDGRGAYYFDESVGFVAWSDPLSEN